MKLAHSVAALGLLASQAAFAGGVERSVPSVGFLFEQGNYLEFSFAHVSPTISGTQAITVAPFPAGSTSGDIGDSYWQAALAMKLDLSDRVALGFVIDQPIGAATTYPTGVYVFTGATASLNATETRAILKYKATDRVSVFGGLRYQTASGVAHIPTAAAGAGYRLDSGSSSQTGYMVGAAYERPDIALRVALSYYSAIDHTFASVLEGTTAGTAASLPFTTTVPEAIRLDVQTGIAPGTLAFGSIHHQKWSEFDISPVGFTTAATNPLGLPLVNLTNDVTTFNLGVGRQLNDNLSVSGSVTYEKSNGGFSGNLNPTDGRTSLGLGVRYKMDDGPTISGGVSYSWLGDADTAAPGTTSTLLSNFTNNSSLAVGMKVGFNF